MGDTGWLKPGVKVTTRWAAELGARLSWWRPGITGVVDAVHRNDDGSIRSVIVEWVKGRVWESHSADELMPV